MTWNRFLTRILGGAPVDDAEETERAALEVANRLEAATTRLEMAVDEMYSALEQVEKP